MVGWLGKVKRRPQTVKPFFKSFKPFNYESRLVFNDLFQPTFQYL